MTNNEIWFWQSIVSPHMAGLARALADLGYKVTYVAAQPMSPARAAQGWQLPLLGNAELQLAPTKSAALELAAASPEQAVHICQGIRGNGQVSQVQRLLARLRRKQWVLMETVDDSGWRGLFKRLKYRRLFCRLEPYLQGVLAIGHVTPAWLVNIGVSAEKVVSFAYFLPDDIMLPEVGRPTRQQGERYRFLFVGQFIERKRLDLLIDAITGFHGKDIELAVVGSGPLEQELRTKAQRQLFGRIDWIGRLPIEEVPQQMLQADCLVLPSRFDGWGAVVSEALMAGTPVICSDRCGAAEVVYASGAGGVFKANDVDSLAEHLARQYVSSTRIALTREELAEWARCLGASAGAAYLAKIIEYQGNNNNRPLSPWSLSAG